jgi:hypothetical protein
MVGIVNTDRTAAVAIVDRTTLHNDVFVYNNKTITALSSGLWSSAEPPPVGDSSNTYPGTSFNCKYFYECTYVVLSVPRLVLW